MEAIEKAEEPKRPDIKELVYMCICSLSYTARIIVKMPSYANAFGSNSKLALPALFSKSASLPLTG